MRKQLIWKLVLVVTLFVIFLPMALANWRCMLMNTVRLARPMGLSRMRTLVGCRFMPRVRARTFARVQYKRIAQVSCSPPEKRAVSVISMRR